ncbi:MAG: acyltransferase domain-containing protein, partial [Archangium sp.]
MLCHSLGEYVAACLAGVFGLEEALALVADRARLMQSLPPGAMLAVPLPEQELRALLGEQCDLAAVNGPAQCVASGPREAIADLAGRLSARGVDVRHLPTSHAFHSRMMDSLLETFTARVARVPLAAPRLPFISSLTGSLITAQEAQSPEYWARQLRGMVRFADGLRTAWAQPDVLLLEVGPGNTLSVLARRGGCAPERVITSARHAQQEGGSDTEALLEALGRLWCAGVSVDWAEFHANESRSRIPLPTYPFERQRHWIEPAKAAPPSPSVPEVDRALHVPAWRPVEALEETAVERMLARPASWLVLCEEGGLGAHVVERLTQASQSVLTVKRDVRTAPSAPESATYATALELERWLEPIAASGRLPTRILYLPGPAQRLEAVEGLAALARVLARHPPAEPVLLGVVTPQPSLEEGTPAARAALLGACRGLRMELPSVTCAHITVEPGMPEAVEHLLGEFAAALPEDSVAYRDGHRHLEEYTPAPAREGAGRGAGLREGGSYLLMGELDGAGAAL